MSYSYWLLAFVFLYRLVPHVVSLTQGLILGGELAHHGVPFEEWEKASTVMQARTPAVMDRWAHRYHSDFVHHPASLFMDVEVFRVWPWIWPLWLGARTRLTSRMFYRWLNHR